MPYQPGSSACVFGHRALPTWEDALEHRTRPIDSTAHSPDVRERQDSGISTTTERGVFAHRIPLLSFRFAGAFLLRLGARTLSALLFHPPPRKTAWFGLALACSAERRLRQTAESNSTKHVLPQAIGIGMGGMSQPALDAPANALHAEQATGIELALQTQSADEPSGGGLAQETVRGKDAVAQKVNAILGAHHLALAGVQAQTQAGEVRGHGIFDLPEGAFAVAKDNEIITVY